ncbi:MAG: hypothetical protein BWY42_01025 [Candidatus Omnitrophica bacterium ADurb.Bin277]|nr:MAG: hypothetical protein BWY42_01025 [Candidatus Omnitrophica bacterium ADurb.Bin277]
MIGSRGRTTRIVISALAIFFVFYVMRGKIFESLSILRYETNWTWIVAAFFSYLAGLSIIAVRMRLVFRVQNIRMGFRECYYLGFVGMFYNLFLPSAVGGDIARAYYAYKYSGKKVESATSILLDRLMGFVAIICIAFLGLLISSKDMHTSYIDYCVYGAFAILVFCLAFFASRRFAGLFKWLEVFVPGRKWKDRLAEVYDAIYNYRHHHGPVLGAIGISFVSQAVFVATYYWIALGLGASIPFWKFFILIPVVTIVSMAPSIGGLGVREASTLYLFSRYMAPERALAFTLLIDLLIYGFSLGAGIVYAFRGGLKPKELRDMEMMQTKVG